MNPTQKDSDPVGCGLLGCLGGVLLGLFGGGILLVAAALLAAVNTTVNLPASPANVPDLSATLEENFVNRYVEQPPEGQVVIDLQPGNQVQIAADTSVEVFGLVVPVQVVGLLQLELVGPQSIHVSLKDTQVFGVDLDVSDMFTEDVQAINQQLDGMVDEFSATLGVPVELTKLETTDSQIRIEAKEAQ